MFAGYQIGFGSELGNKVCYKIVCVETVERHNPDKANPTKKKKTFLPFHVNVLNLICAWVG